MACLVAAKDPANGHEVNLWDDEWVWQEYPEHASESAFDLRFDTEDEADEMADALYIAGFIVSWGYELEDDHPWSSLDDDWCADDEPIII